MQITCLLNSPERGITYFGSLPGVHGRNDSINIALTNSSLVNVGIDRNQCSIKVRTYEHSLFIGCVFILTTVRFNDGIEFNGGRRYYERNGMNYKKLFSNFEKSKRLSVRTGTVNDYYKNTTYVNPKVISHF